MSEETESLCKAGTNFREQKKQQTWQRIHEVSLELVRERGLAGVTVEQICAQAGISQRTFFNYFPTKAAGVLGLSEPQVPAALAESFITGEGVLLDDVCDLVVLVLPQRRKFKHLVQDYPELESAVREWLGEVRNSLLKLVSRRTDETSARLAVTVIVVVLMQAIHDDRTLEGEQLSLELKKTMRQMRRLLPED